MAAASTERVLRQELQAIVDGLCSAAGFAVAVVSVLRDTDEVEVVAVAGDHQARTELMGDTVSHAMVERMLAESQRWGALHFLPHDRAMAVAREGDIWVGRTETVDHPEAWQPRDLLHVPVVDREGRLVGLVGVDQPHDGLRPLAGRRAEVEGHLILAAREVLRCLQREGVVEEIRLTEAAHLAIRAMTTRLGPEETFAAVRTTLVESFHAVTALVLSVGAPGEQLRALDAVPLDLPEAIWDIAAALTRRCWRSRRVAVVAARRFAPGLLDAEEHRLFADHLTTRGRASLVLVPLGSGEELIGALVLIRDDPLDPWSDEQAEAAMEIGHDLSRALLNARSFARERELVEQLQRVGEHRAQLIQTVAHELKSPLTTIIGHLELVRDLPQTSTTRDSLRAIERGTDSLGRLVADLLILSESGGTGSAGMDEAGPVDLGALAAEAVQASMLQADRKLLRVVLQVPDAPVHALGVRRELAHVADNLVTNAVTYTPEGRSVFVSVERVGAEAVLTCRDEGIGMSAADAERIFEEFFRSTNPEALGIPGTGLGLAIVHRIVERHGGRVELETATGAGTTVRVVLPAP